MINARYGGFHLSEQAARWLRAHGVTDEWALYNWSDRPRHDPLLVECVETLGPAAGEDLMVVIAHGDRYFINEYDGLETVIDDASDCWIYL